jgi:chlorite dismutase
MYIDQVDPFHTAESRAQIIPGKRKQLFVYPFVKTHEWMEVRETESCKYTQRDTPIFTCVQMPVDDVLAQLF